MSYPKLRHTALALVLLLRSTASWAVALDAVSLLKTLDASHPRCEQPADLSVMRDAFVPVGNDLPGVREYNQMTVLASEGRWMELEGAAAAFRRQFETSPLQEAVTFLLVNARFEKEPDPRGQDAREAEKFHREAVLLYPQSTLIPATLGTVANYYLRQKNYEKSLALYQAARDEHPLHDLACVFQLGLAESRYFLREYPAAEASYQLALQKCKNRRVITGAQLRLMELKQVHEAKVGNDYDSLYQGHAAQIDRYFPSTLYNYAEARYSQKDYSRAKFYFSQYIKTVPPGAECVVHAQKRLADIAFRSNEKIPSVVGQYLAIHEKSATTPVGTYSKIHALLLELPWVSNPEYQRRIRWIDETIDSIGEEPLRKLAYLEKGIVLLGMGDERAIGYLVRLNEQTSFNLNKGAVSAYVRENLLKLLESKDKAFMAPVKSQVESAQVEAKVLDDLEQAFNVWLKGTTWESRGKQLYGKVILARIENAAKSGNAEHVSELLNRWKTSGLVDPKKLEISSRRRVVASLLRSLLESESPEKLAIAFLKNESELKAFVEPFGGPFWTAVAVESGDDRRLSFLGKDRTPLSVDSQLPNELKDYIWLVNGRALLKVKKDKEAESALMKVQDKELKTIANRLRLKLYQDTKQYAKAYELALKEYQEAEAEEKKDELKQLLQLASDGKVWSKASDLLKLSEQAGVEGKEKAPFLYLAGRANFERKQCKQALDHYEHALVADAEATDAAEARYRMGKCFVQMRKPTAAKKVWEDLIAMQDSFWSPLAKNEIRLIQ